MSVSTPFHPLQLPMSSLCPVLLESWLVSHSWMKSWHRSRKGTACLRVARGFRSLAVCREEQRYFSSVSLSWLGIHGCVCFWLEDSSPLWGPKCAFWRGQCDLMLRRIMSISCPTHPHGLTDNAGHHDQRQFPTGKTPEALATGDIRYAGPYSADCLRWWLITDWFWCIGRGVT